MSAKLLTTGSAKVRKIKPAKAKAGSSVAGGGRNETGHLQNSNSFHERYAAARGLSRAAREKNASRRKITKDNLLSYCFYLSKNHSSHKGKPPGAQQGDSSSLGRPPGTEKKAADARVTCPSCSSVIRLMPRGPGPVRERAPAFRCARPAVRRSRPGARRWP